MNEEELGKMDREILELVNAAAQEWQTKEESLRLLMAAKEVAEIRNFKLDKSVKIMLKDWN